MLLCFVLSIGFISKHDHFQVLAVLVSLTIHAFYDGIDKNLRTPATEHIVVQSLDCFAECWQFLVQAELLGVMTEQMHQNTSVFTKWRRKCRLKNVHFLVLWLMF